MKTTDTTVMIREPGTDETELTSGTLRAHSLDYQNPEGWMGQPVTIHTYDDNGNPEERTGEPVAIL